MVTNKFYAHIMDLGECIKYPQDLFDLYRHINILDREVKSKFNTVYFFDLHNLRNVIMINFCKTIVLILNIPNIEEFAVFVDN